VPHFTDSDLTNLIILSSSEVQVYLWYVCRNVLTISYFDVAKSTTQNPLSLLISHKQSFPVVGFKTSSHSTFALKYDKSLMWYFENPSNANSCSSQKLHFAPPLLSSVGACTFRTVLPHQWPLRVIYDILSPLTKSTLLTPEMIPCMRKSLPLNDDYSSFS
jgi:hypothetical protein